MQALSIGGIVATEEDCTVKSQPPVSTRLPQYVSRETAPGTFHVKRTV